MKKLVNWCNTMAFGMLPESIPQESNTKKKYEDVKQGLVGSVLNVYGTAQVRKLQEIAVTQSRLGIPLIFGMDVIHGYIKLPFRCP